MIKNKPKLLLTRGAPGCGKTTFAIEWVAEDPTWRTRINRDDLRFMLFNSYVLDRMGEETVTLFQQTLARTALGAGRNVIIDDTNLAARYVREWIALAEDFSVEVEFVDFDTPLEVCLARNATRAAAGGREVPEDVIRGYFQRFYRKGKLPDVPLAAVDKSEVRRIYEPDVTLPKAYLFDIDGTLAQMTGRNPFAWDRVGEDSPIENVIRLAQALAESGYYVVFMSGRDRVCYPQTLDWLVEHVVTWDTVQNIELYMRAENDSRRDSIVKHELFYKHVADKYHVVGVVDDRQQVVDMWRDIGLTVFQCAKGDF